MFWSSSSCSAVSLKTIKTRKYLWESNERKECFRSVKPFIYHLVDLNFTRPNLHLQLEFFFFCHVISYNVKNQTFIKLGCKINLKICITLSDLFWVTAVRANKCFTNFKSRWSRIVWLIFTDSHVRISNIST